MNGLLLFQTSPCVSQSMLRHVWANLCFAMCEPIHIYHTYTYIHTYTYTYTYIHIYKIVRHVCEPIYASFTPPKRRWIVISRDFHLRHVHIELIFVAVLHKFTVTVTVTMTATVTVTVTVTAILPQMALNRWLILHASHYLPRNDLGSSYFHNFHSSDVHIMLLPRCVEYRHNHIDTYI
jgi:hypothetical protein